MYHSQRVFKNVGALWQKIKEKMRGGIFGAFVVAQSSLPFVATQHIDRFQATGAHILHVHVFHITVHLELDPHFQFASWFERLSF